MADRTVSDFITEYTESLRRREPIEGKTWTVTQGEWDMLAKIFGGKEKFAANPMYLGRKVVRK